MRFLIVYWLLSLLCGPLVGVARMSTQRKLSNSSQLQAARTKLLLYLLSASYPLLVLAYGTLSFMMQVVMFSKLIISILLLPSLFFLASSSSVESEATCVGIDFSSGAYVCTSNPVETRRAVHHVSPSYDDMDLGVVQRMSGSAGET